MRAVVIVYSLMIVGAAALGRALGTPSLFTAPAGGEGVVASLVAAVALALVVVAVGRRLESRPWYRAMGDTLRHALEVALGPDFDHYAIAVAAYSAVGEEALFRGVVQPWLIGLAGQLLDPDGPPGLLATALGVTGAALVFGLVHLPRVKELRPWTVFAFVVGLLFGVLAAASGSLLAPIVAHLVINWLNMRRLKSFPRPSDPTGVAPRGPLM